jgi:uncharacterized protein (DUF1697 family)
MPAVVALLRGVNVGGRNKLSMNDLRRIAADCGFEQVRTYIQSGNIVFDTSEVDMRALAQRLRQQIGKDAGLAPEVTLRTRAELVQAIADSPFPQRGLDANFCHIVFLLDGDEPPSLAGLDVAAYAPDEAVLVGRELHLYLPDGMGRSKLAADVGRRRQLAGTARNWRTVTTLLAMADEVA